MDYIQRVTVGEKCLEDYRGVVGNGLIDEINSLGQRLQGTKMIHLNATPDGGGVAEILRGLTPLLRYVGIQTEWYVLKDGLNFFAITKKIHDLLQGGTGGLTDKEKQFYVGINRSIGEELSSLEADIIVIHDPQPLPAASYVHNCPNIISHLHIDLSKPNRRTFNFIGSLLGAYSRVVVSLPYYAEREAWRDRRVVISPAIDPLNIKNRLMRETQARAIVQSMGLNPGKPILLQVLRFDRWKDPFGTLEAHRILKKKFSELQTVLLGFNIAQDDSGARAVYEQVKKRALRMKDVSLFFDIADARGRPIDIIVNAFLTCASAVLHKSIREGFGLVVTEAMWKGRAVVGGDVGGIRYQIQDGVSGYLVRDARQAAERIEALLSDPLLAKHIGERARERARKHFLLPRMLRDYLKLVADLTTPNAQEGFMRAPHAGGEIRLAESRD